MIVTEKKISEATKHATLEKNVTKNSVLVE